MFVARRIENSFYEKQTITCVARALAASNLNSVQSKKNSSLSASDKVIVLASRTHGVPISQFQVAYKENSRKSPKSQRTISFTLKNDNVPLSAHVLLWKIRLVEGTAQFLTSF
jgi:hypothetical protein